MDSQVPQDEVEREARILASGIAGLQAVLLDTESIDRFVQELAVQAARLVDGSLSCGITLSRRGTVSTMACSDDLASAVNEVQYRLGEGPALTAMTECCAVRADDLAAETRWPGFCREAVSQGVLSVLSMPLIAPGSQEEAGSQDGPADQDGAERQDEQESSDPAGAVSLYAKEAGAFGREETRRAERFARDAAGALALGLRLVGYAELAGQLRESLSSRAVIDQAMGVLMGQQRCSQDAAFAMLRAASQNRNVKLRDIAEQVVSGVTGEPVQQPPFGNG